LAHMMVAAAGHGIAGQAADVAALLTERGLGGNDPDLDVRHRRWRSDRGPRAEAARRMARRWADRADGAPGGDLSDLPRAVALAFPERLSRRRDPGGEHWQSAGGRGFRLDPASPLARSEWLAVAEVAGAALGARILSAAAIDWPAIEALFPDRIERFRDARFDPATRKIEATHGRRLGAIRLSSARDPDPDPAAIEAGLVDAVRRHGVGILPWPESALALRRRATFARTIDPGLPDVSDIALLDRLEDWLAPLLAGRRDLDLPASAMAGALDGLLGHDARRAVDRLTPSHLATPAGSLHPIDYGAPGGPLVEVRAQALFGLTTHPQVGGGQVPLTIAITSPAHRPIQTTRDLPAFWAGSWRDVAKEMRGRYPKHPWPDDPASAAPTLRTKRATKP
jgi:ATP-dependent helicase HrpB